MVFFAHLLFSSTMLSTCLTLLLYCISFSTAGLLWTENQHISQPFTEFTPARSISHGSNKFKYLLKGKIYLSTKNRQTMLDFISMSAEITEMKHTTFKLILPLNFAIQKLHNLLCIDNILYSFICLI